MRAVKEKNRSNQKLTTRSIGFTHSVPIYVNEHITTARKRLLSLAVAKKKEVRWAYGQMGIWTDANGTIYARKTSDDRAIIIGSPADVQKIC